MSWISVDSSNIDKIKHEDNNLYVQFLDGSIYEYIDVPHNIYQNMLTSQSKGKYLHQYIKGFYQYNRVET